MRYEFRLVDVAAMHQQEDGALSFNPDERLAAWPITAYGKTPTAFLQSDEEAVNLAAVVALRDAGAHFVTSFGATPDVAVWLDVIARRQSSIAEAPGGTTESADQMTSNSAETEVAAVESAASDPSETAPVESEESPDTPPVASAAASGVAQDAAEETEPASPTSEEPAPVDTEAASGEAL